MQFIVEEKILSDYLLDPFLVVGVEGMWGVMICLGLLSPMQILTCENFGTTFSALCNFGYMENSAYAFKQMSDRNIIWLANLMIMITIAGLNGFGTALTKYGSAAQRTTIMASRIVVICILSCLFLGEKFEPWAIPGLIMIIIGTLMYNEIVVIPYFGFNLNTKTVIAAREKNK